MEFAALRETQIKTCQSTLNYQTIYPSEPHPSTTCVFKRSVDIIGSLIGLFLLAILFLPVSLAIGIDSPGPVFFRQRRVGLGGKLFYLWKFRSMVPDAERLKSDVENQASGFIFKNKNDPRITRVGRFLRRTSLDELPQFWNVLMGEMSLVGTRPPTLDEVEQYTPHQWLRLAVKPGITGEWQVRGRSTVLNFDDVVSLDLAYQNKWSVCYDIILIARTIPVVLFGRGAC